MSLLPPPSRLVTDPGLEGSVHLGMPHLVPGGLSETWLLRHLGDVHWQMLARQLGCAPSRITDRTGTRVYAAFRHVTLEGLRLDAAREDGRLEVRSHLWRLSRTQVLSRHALMLDGAAAGTAILVSAFVRREAASNRRICRVEVPGLADLPDWDGARPAPLVLPQAPEAARLTFTPCPAEDFNGAGFLYFSSYVSLAERALFSHAPGLARATTARGRRIAYQGNIDPGDAVDILTHLADAQGGTLCTTRLVRGGDAAVLAEMVALRTPAAP
ncbi:hypothetical protein J5J86_03645 [Aquabacter sp. L1I39]|uniref:Pnap_2097 family protein n=1 Tax=Aquabacter sp. L1I39 TaxID=2820278 RepID=UPI001ADA9FEF|nr:Pnap_2097 family protein [Aquabacter sp. L1I39]QTL04449.1 hypothetical protein J5J86_03645 [Aquabacter sp. L1I39]